jgi:hypothetical protein
MIREYKPADNAIFEHSTTPVKLIGGIGRFMVSEEGSECLRPLVDQVMIRFDHSLLRLGVIVMDIPRTGDTNTSRVRHAEEIKDSADVLLILANTDRTATNDSVYKTVRNCVLSRGSYDEVKLVATQIDNIVDSDLKREGVDRLRELIEAAAAEVRNVEEEEDAVTVIRAGKYKTYLQRYLVQLFVK